MSIRARFDAYQEALASHDPDRILSHFASDYTMVFEKSGFSMDREQARSALGWDAGVRGRYEFDDVTIEKRTVSCTCVERNGFFDALGIDGIRSEATFRFNNDGLIDRQTYRELPGQPSWQKKLEPVIEWARKHRPDELEKVYPDDNMVFSEKAGRRWIQLLEQYPGAI